MNTYTLLPLVQSLFCSILAVVILKGHLRSYIHRLFFFFLISLALWGIIVFGMRSSPTLEGAYFWDRLMIPLSPFMAVVFYNFSIRFTDTTIKKWILPTAYLVCVFLIPLIATPYVFSGMQIKTYGYAPVFGPVWPVWIILIYIITILTLATFIKARKTTSSTNQKNRLTYIIIGIIISLIGGAFDALPVFGLPLYPGAILGTLVFCSLVAITILKYQLLDINIVLRKGIASLLMSTVVATPYVGIIIVVYLIFERTLPLWGNITLLIVLAISLQPLWQRIQRLVDRLFFGSRLDLLNALTEFSRQTHNVSELDQLGNTLVKLISQAFRSKNVILLLASEERYSVVASTERDGFEVILENDNPVLSWLNYTKSLLQYRELEIVPKLLTLTTRERNDLKKLQADIFVPIHTKEKKLVGLITISKKASGHPFTEEDKQVIFAVANQVATELDNARLFETEKVARRKTEEQDAQKTEFLHSVAHELKTPLTAIISSSEILIEESHISNTFKRKLITNIHSGAQSMDRRIAELLDLAKLQTGLFEIKKEFIDMGNVLKTVASQLKILFKQKEQLLTLQIPNLPLNVEADNSALEQIIFNLFSNANKFSPSESSVIVRAMHSDGKVIVEVEDSAPIIDEEEKPRIFNPYYRGDDADKRERYPGLGLGLATTKKLVELHKGEIWIRSKPGKGNIFGFSLPTSEEVNSNSLNG
jgi:signal transduction histidine kinase